MKSSQAHGYGACSYERWNGGQLGVLLALAVSACAADIDDSGHEGPLGQSSFELATEADYEDPGTGDWQQGSEAECGLDLGKLADSKISRYAIFRNGKLCRMKGLDLPGAMFSATKTLGGVMVGRAAYLTRNIARKGRATGTILPEDPATFWLDSVSYNNDALLTHVMSMTADNASLREGEKIFEYDTIGTTQINSLIDVTKKAIKQITNDDAVGFVKKEIFDKLGMKSSAWTPYPSLFSPAGIGIASGWQANMNDMGRLGMLLLHGGWYNGEQIVSKEWVYRMSHPAFEDANTAYGHLMWLNHRGHSAGAGGNIGNTAAGIPADDCAPAALWPASAYPRNSYQRILDCYPAAPYTSANCRQTYDVGVYSAQGLGGQYIVMHPGLDMVIVAHDFNEEVNGPMELWAAVRPALRARDPLYKNDGDDRAFCAAYGAGSYAPNLVMPRSP